MRRDSQIKGTNTQNIQIHSQKLSPHSKSLSLSLVHSQLLTNTEETHSQTLLEALLAVTLVPIVPAKLTSGPRMRVLDTN